MLDSGYNVSEDEYKLQWILHYNNDDMQPSSQSFKELLIFVLIHGLLLSTELLSKIPITGHWQMQF